MDDYYGNNKVYLTAADFKQSERYYNKKGLCEDTRLSLAAIGQPFTAFALDATRIPTLTLVQLQVWLDTLSSFAFFDDVKVTAPSQKKELGNIQQAVQALAIGDRVSAGGDLASKL